MEIKIEDLMTNCDRCKGRGEIHEPETGTNAGCTSNIGIGPVHYSGPCPKCDGKGFTLTSSGAAIQQLFSRLKSRHLI
jgi:DnaJ-class molecular chaperone